MLQENESKIKLLVLYEILCRLTDENHALNSDEIVEELSKRGIKINRRVISADIDLLNKFGYEVLSYKKKYIYYYVVNRPFDTAEVVMLADVVKASKLSVEQKNTLIEKLSVTLGQHQAALLSKHIISLESGFKKGGYSLIYNVDAIDRAINENKQVTFLYFDYDEKKKKVYRKNGGRYTANPIVMVWNKDNYYLLCFNNNHDNIVTYRIDKMADVRVEETERQPHREYEAFNTEEYRNQVFSMFCGELQNVTLSVASEMLSDIFDKFGDSAKITKKPDGTYEANIKVQVSRPFFAWIIGSQGKVKVKHPHKVLEEFNNFIAKVKEAY